MQINRLGVLISGSGSNLQAIMDAISEGKIKGEIQVVISHKEDAYGLERAKKQGIPAVFLDPKKFETNEEYHKEMIAILEKHRVNFVVLAGYLKILTPSFVREYEGRMINIHPSLIPKYCGKGFYGIKVHEAVIKNKEKESGATVHFVDEGTDTGEIILQRKVTVDKEDTPESLQQKVLKVEHQILIEALQSVLE